MVETALQDLAALLGTAANPQATTHEFWPTAGRLGLALVFGLCVAATYAVTRRRTPGGEGFSTTLVLLSVFVAMTTIVIDNSVARAFSLVGALAIVRFRTAVDDTRDTAFVIFAVVVGMAVGAGNLMVCLSGIPIVALTTFVASRRTRARDAAEGLETRVLVRFGVGQDLEKRIAELLGQHASRLQLRAITTVRQGAALEARYAMQLRPPERPFDLVAALNQLAGVQHVEIEARG